MTVMFMMVRFLKRQLTRKIKKQIKLCLKYPNYKSALFINHNKYYSIYCIKIRHFLQLRVGAENYLIQSKPFTVVFKNNSRFEIIPFSMFTKAKRVNSYIVDKDIPKLAYDCKIEPLITPYTTYKGKNVNMAKHISKIKII